MGTDIHRLYSFELHAIPIPRNDEEAQMRVSDHKLNELKQLKRFLLTICKEDDTEYCLFSNKALVEFLDSFDRRIEDFQYELDSSEDEEGYLIKPKKSDVKLLNKWKKLSKEAHKFLNKTYTEKYLVSIGYGGREKLLKSKPIQKYK